MNLEEQINKHLMEEYKQFINSEEKVPIGKGLLDYIENSGIKSWVSYDKDNIRKAYDDYIKELQIKRRDSTLHVNMYIPGYDYNMRNTIRSQNYFVKKSKKYPHITIYNIFKEKSDYKITFNEKTKLYKVIVNRVIKGTYNDFNTAYLVINQINK